MRVPLLPQRLLPRAPAAPARQPPPLKGVSALNIEPTLRGPNIPWQHPSKGPARREHPPPPPRPEPPPNAPRRPRPGTARSGPLRRGPGGCPAARTRHSARRGAPSGRRAELLSAGGSRPARPGPASLRPPLPSPPARGRRSRRPPPRGPVGSRLAPPVGRVGPGRGGHRVSPGARRIPAAARDTPRGGSSSRRSPQALRAGEPREESGHGRRAELPGCGHRGVAGPGAGQFGIHSLMLTNSPWTRQGTNWATALFWILISFIIRNPVSFQIKCNLETLAPHAEIFFSFCILLAWQSSQWASLQTITDLPTTQPPKARATQAWNACPERNSNHLYTQHWPCHLVKI